MQISEINYNLFPPLQKSFVYGQQTKAFNVKNTYTNQQRKTQRHLFVQYQHKDNNKTTIYIVLLSFC